MAGVLLDRVQLDYKGVLHLSHVSYLVAHVVLLRLFEELVFGHDLDGVDLVLGGAY